MIRHNKKAFVIVDAYATGRFLAPYINANGYTCIHIQSCNPVIAVYWASFSREHFIDNLIYSNNLPELVNYLKSYDIKGIIPGAETGVLLADLLNEALDLPTSNGTKVSLARRDKFQMVQRLESCGVRYARSFKSHYLKEILEWAGQYNLFPMVIKPLTSSGSHGVKICNTLEEITCAFNEIMHQGDFFNEPNQAVLIQEFLNGQEYIVNTVSYQGRHHVVDIWRKYKILESGIPINDYSELVHPDELIYSQLSAYISDVLNALEIKFGAGHSEIMVTNSGPVLIETAARLAGSIDPSAVMEALGENQVIRLLQSYMNPPLFLQTFNTQQQPRPARHIFFISPVSGLIHQSPQLQAMTELASFHSIFFRFNKGSQLLKTSTLADFPGFCYLIADTKEQIEKEYRMLRQAEKTLYTNMLAE